MSDATQRAEAIIDRLERRLDDTRRATAQAAGNVTRERPVSTQAADALPLERADEIVTRVTERVGAWLSEANLQVRRAAALAREEAEDIWAEAQAMHQGQPQPPPTP